jgi:hypothetical protein
MHLGLLSCYCTLLSHYSSSSDEEIEGGSDSEHDDENEEGAGEDASFSCLLDGMLDQVRAPSTYANYYYTLTRRASASVFARSSNSTFSGLRITACLPIKSSAQALLCRIRCQTSQDQCLRAELHSRNTVYEAVHAVISDNIAYISATLSLLALVACMHMVLQLDTAEDTTEQSAIFSQLVGTVKALLLTQADFTGAALTWLLYDVASHPAVQNRLRAELRSIGSGATSSGRFAAKARSRTRSARPALDTVAEVTPEAATATAASTGADAGGAVAGGDATETAKGANATGSETSSSEEAGADANRPSTTAADVISSTADSLESPGNQLN